MGKDQQFETKLIFKGTSKASTEESHIQPRAFYPADRKQQYEATIAEGSSPFIKKNASTTRRGIPAAPNSPAGRSIHNPMMSFVMLTDSQIQPSSISPARQSNNPDTKQDAETDTALSYKIESNTRLFEILSSRSDIDHPICTECTELLLSQFESRLQAASKERDAYITFLKELKNNVPTEAEVNKAKTDLAMAKQAEEEAFASLLELQKEKEALEQALQEVELESRKLDEGEEQFWRSRNQFDTKVSSLANIRDALNASYAHDVDQLEKLRRTNIHNDLFCIGHDGNFGTINGLRLGRLAAPNHVEWPEINAAWGATAHLLATVADRLGYTFRGYVLKPMGSTSRIEKLDNTGSSVASSLAVASRGSSQAQVRVNTLELFSSGGLSLGKTILHRKFNEAMVAFLECLRQLGEHVDHVSRTRSSEVRKLPYAIERDKIHGVSIKIGISQDEQWTSACKYTLTCCKFLLAYASNMASASIAGSSGR